MRRLTDGRQSSKVVVNNQLFLSKDPYAIIMAGYCKFIFFIFVVVFQELDVEREKTAALEKELQELKSNTERHTRVSKLLMEELTALKQHADRDREMAET